MREKRHQSSANDGRRREIMDVVEHGDDVGVGVDVQHHHTPALRARPRRG